MDAYKTVEMSPAIKATYQEALTSKAKLGHDFLNLIHVVYEAPGALISPKKNGVENTIPTSTTGLERASTSGLPGENPENNTPTHPSEGISELKTPSPCPPDCDVDNSLSGESDAISDTSFTPPTLWQLTKLARLDGNGRRHVLAPTVFRAEPVIDNTECQLAYDDSAEQCESCMKASETLFERRRDFKKAGVERGGISLAVEREKSQRAQETKGNRRIRFEVQAPPLCSAIDSSSGLMVPTDQKPSHHQDTRKERVRNEQVAPTGQREVSPPPDQPEELPPTDRGAASWTCPLLKKVFETENDLLYDSRWPASTF
ncbi:hypothetical protein F5B17DRAFT_433061 [Nemania serpens]|nr:hypothetical protein F5B17DRAFT_433061 [Nemania serpens]